MSPLAREDACRNCQAGPLVWFAGTPNQGLFAVGRFGVYRSFVYTLPVASAIAIAPKTTAPDLVSRSQIRGFPQARTALLAPHLSVGHPS